MLSDLDLIRLHVDALYTSEEERLVQVNDIDGPEAARFFLGKTVEGNIWRFRQDVPERTVNKIVELCRDELADLTPGLVHREEYLRILAEDRPVEHVHGEPAFVFETQPVTVFDKSRQNAGGPVILVTPENADVLMGGELEPWIRDVEHDRPLFAVLIDGRAVSVCASVRLTEAAHECGVETITTHRGKGLAALACHAWANAMRQAGIVPLYSTFWENTASRRLAENLRLRQYGATFHAS